MKNIIKDALILFLITAFAGVLLAVVNEVTKQPIADMQAKAKEEALKSVFEGDGIVFTQAELLTVSENALVSDWEEEYGTRNRIDEVYLASDAAGTLQGYVLTVTNKEGYGGEITFSMGVTLDKVLNGISILETSETVGLGLEAEAVLAPQFAGKQVDAFTYTKNGAINDSEVDAISSATISTNAYVNGVNAGLAYFDLLNEKGGESNE